ncbi:MAG: DUF1189 family protein, partial [Patescibacteria group bacterium]
MKYFFTAFYKSCYDPTWLKAARKFPGKAWSYFCLLVFVLALAATIPVWREASSLLGEFQTEFSAQSPDFQVNLKNGKLTIEKLDQPFVYRSEELVVIVDTDTTSSVAAERFVTSTDISTLLITSDRGELRNINTA